MQSNPASPPAPTRPGRRAWSQVLLYAAAILMMVAGGGALIWKRIVARPGAAVTGEIMAGLEAADHIEADRGALQDWNVLFVSFDTTRADHLACYGNRGVHTPTLDQLAREGILFTDAVTPVPATLPAHSSLLTGLYPYHHGARANGTFKLEDRNRTLAEILLARGYRTAAAISAYVLDSTYGLAQGFELYHDDLTRGIKHAPNMFRERPAELTNEAIFPWLGEHADQRFFCWVHYFDPHATYMPPEPFRTEYVQNLYDGEIAYADDQLGKLLNWLEELGVRDRTLVVMTADHGEGLGEHGEQTHSLLIYDSTLHVPLIMHAPGGLPEGKVIKRQASLVDVVPTVLDLLGIEPPDELDGRSLLGSAPTGPRACYIETLSSKTLHGWAPLLGVRREDYKFILAPRPEVYDLRRDPKELENLYESQPDVAVDLHEVLKGFVGDDPLLAAEVTQNLEMDEEAIRKLAALGYVATVAERGGDADRAMDPKDGVVHWERVQEATNLRNTGNIKGAIEILESCLEEVPGDVFARQILAGAYQTYGRSEDALESLRVAAELSPSDPGLALGMAAVYLQLGDADLAEQAIERALSLEPDHSGAYLQRAQIAAARRQFDESYDLLQQALEIDRGARKPAILNNIARFHQRRGQMDEAREAYNQALVIDAFNGESHAGLAEIFVTEGNDEDAMGHLQQALRFNPVQPRALVVLAGVLCGQGALDAAIKSCEQALSISPQYGPALANLGLAYRLKGDLTKAEEIYLDGVERAPRCDALHQNLAQLLLRQDRVEEAVESFEAAVRANPFNAVALANIGVLHMQANRGKPARRFLRRALRVRPDYALAHKHLGVLSLGENRVALGMFHLKRSLELDPQQPEAGKIRFQLEANRAEAPSGRPIFEEVPDEETDLNARPLDPDEEDSGS